ncbi:MAG: winged helix-turn-helix domain-containing protein [Vicinamibacterales bacterium]
MTFRFGVFEFVPGTGELRRDGVRVRIEPQPARALGLLLERGGALVTRDEMKAHIWGGDTHVDFDRGLAYSIGQVRTALGDNAENPRFVQTLPRRGYRFIAPIEAVGAAAAGPPAAGVAVAPAAASEVSAPRPRAAGRWWWGVAAAIVAAAGLGWLAWPAPAATRPVVAVAVFDNETGDPAYDRLAAAAADLVVERLTALGPDRVGIVGNTPLLRLPRAQRDPAAIRRETGAEYLVFGQLQQAEGGYRLLAHLIRLDDDTHLWVTRVTRAGPDLPGADELLADRTASAVRLHVIERRPDAPRSTPDAPQAIP